LNNEILNSPRFNAVWGIEKTSKKRSDFTALIHPDDLPLRAEAHRLALITGDLHYEARISRRDGVPRWIKAKGKVLYDNQGTPVRLLGVIQDITEMKDYAEELSKKVEERTNSLNEVNVRLKRSNEELEEFAYIASHDLQEPLRKIQLFNTMIIGQPGLPENAKQYIEKISSAANRMTGLIKDLLEYSKLSNKSMRFEKTDLNVIIGNILTDYELLISQKNAILNVEPLPIIEAIPLQMNQLLFNLIGNALKFARSNVTPVITVSASYLAEDRKAGFPGLSLASKYLEIRVSDNGIGFNQEYANKIFTIFQKLNEKSLYSGYGIGLALCRKIIENHSGFIYAEGRPKEGASFIFIIPCEQVNR
jgi:PAS domain S-box-containing protein